VLDSVAAADGESDCSRVGAKLVLGEGCILLVEGSLLAEGLIVVEGPKLVEGDMLVVGPILFVGSPEGVTVGSALGSKLGWRVVGAIDGAKLGDFVVGARVTGAREGPSVAAVVGLGVGAVLVVGVVVGSGVSGIGVVVGTEVGPGDVVGPKVVGMSVVVIVAVGEGVVRVAPETGALPFSCVGGDGCPGVCVGVKVREETTPVLRLSPSRKRDQNTVSSLAVVFAVVVLFTMVSIRRLVETPTEASFSEDTQVKNTNNKAFPRKRDVTLMFLASQQRL
jgi:hypothetical protein